MATVIMAIKVDAECHTGQVKWTNAVTRGGDELTVMEKAHLDHHYSPNTC